MKFLGIDPGVRNLGLCAIDSEGDVNVQYVTKDNPEHIPTSCIMCDFIRCQFLKSIVYRWLIDNTGSLRVIDAVTGLTLNPFVVVVEGPSMFSVGKRVQVGFLHMAIYQALTRRVGALIAIVPPTVWKKWLTGKGNAGKHAVIECVIRRWFAEDKADDRYRQLVSQDLYDAFALAKFGQAMMQQEVDVNLVEKISTYRVEKGYVDRVSWVELWQTLAA